MKRRISLEALLLLTVTVCTHAVAERPDYQSMVNQNMVVTPTEKAQTVQMRKLLLKVKYGQTRGLPEIDIQTIRNASEFSRDDARAIFEPHIREIEQLLEEVGTDKTVLAIQIAKSFHEARKKEQDAREAIQQDLIASLSEEGQRVLKDALNNSDADLVREVDLVSLAHDVPEFVIAWLTKNVSKFNAAPAAPNSTALESLDIPGTELGIHGGID